MSWGYKIMFVLIGFVAVMAIMVGISMKQTNEMLDANYYNQELKYQEKIDAASRLQRISKEDILKEKNATLSLQIPNDISNNVDSGVIELVKESDMSKDKKYKITKENVQNLVINTAELSTGKYRARISWSNNAITYYKEQSLFIQK